MKINSTFFTAIILASVLTTKSSHAEDILTCQLSGIVQEVTSQNKAKLIKEGFEPVPGEPRIMYQKISPNPTFEVPRSAMKWVGTYYEAYTTTADGENLVVGVDSEFNYHRTWNASYATELSRTLASTGPCWW